jgi:isoleucyl-tRNA synthetase
MPEADVAALAAGGRVSVTLDGRAVELGPDDVVIERRPRPGLVVAADGAIVVALDTTLDAALISEGLAREFVNKVQTMRKSAALDVTQRIAIRFSGPEDVLAAIGTHARYILNETLGIDCEPVHELKDDATAWDLNGRPVSILVRPA